MSLPRIRTPLGQRLGGLRRGPLALLIWLTALLACIWLLDRRSEAGAFTGIVRAIEVEVAAAAPGTLVEFKPALFAEVAMGDVIARLDPSALEARLATASARVFELTARVAAESETSRTAAQQGEQDASTELRRFLMDEVQIRLEALALTTEIEADRIEAERLAIEEVTARKLLEGAATAELDWRNAQLRHQRLLRVISENATRLERLGEDLVAAGERRRAFEARGVPVPAVDALLAPLQDAVSVQEHVIAELRVERAALVVRAPVQGRVTRLVAWPGQAVQAGQALCVITRPVPDEVIVYLPESDPDAIASGSEVRVRTVRRPVRTVDAVVGRVGPAIEAMPQRLWRDQRVPEFGRPVLIDGMQALGLTAGELVTVERL